MSLILHHYPLSPYSEKMRAMLGYAQIDWVSCLTDEAPPRKKLMLLSGGYNRIPIAQIGADIFCDSNLLAEEISQATGLNAFDRQYLDADAQELQRFIESKFFFACVNKAFSFSLLKRFVKDKGLFNLFRFLKDRIGMAKNASISLGSPKSAPKYIAKGLNDVTAYLADEPFLDGENPSLLDFAVYHCVWFAIEVGRIDVLEGYAALQHWYGRMERFKASPSQEIEIDEALAIALESEPREIADSLLNDADIGREVTISATDYRQIPVSGVLVGSDETRWVISRETEETGLVHVHFPKQGYRLSRI